MCARGGGSMIKVFRRHQSLAEAIGAEIHNGERDEKVIVAYVTPGGGKTLMASIFAHQLLKRDVERVLVVCPRLTLKTQMRDGFHVPDLGLTGGLATEYKLTIGLLRDERAGCVTTYQDVVQNPGRWVRFVREVPTLVILDEGHHLQALGWGAEQDEEAGWTPAISPIVEAARRVLVMTGTMERGNGSPVAFVEYDDDRKAKLHIKYTRRDALDEKAILNVSVKLCDGDAEYWHRFSQHRHILSNVSAEEESRALRALLSDEKYRNRVLDEALREFEDYRNTRNAHARMIVIAANQIQARSVKRYLDDKLVRAVLAISDETDAHHRLARFRDRRAGDVLVTCQMAHEGLDVPDCTHLVALTNYRMRSWLEQALSRVTRFDPKCGLPWEEQYAYLYVPADQSMVSFLSEWIDEQDARFNDPPSGEPTGPRSRRSSFSPISGEMTDTRYADTYGVFSDIDQRRIEAFDKLCPYCGHMPAVHRLDMARKIWPTDSDVPDPSKVSAA